MRQFEIAVGGKKLLIPPSAIAGVSDVAFAELVQEGDHWKLVLKCGDASEATRVELEFSASRVLARKIFAGGSLTAIVEETKYHAVIFD